jgi:hypothetical protein
MSAKFKTVPLEKVKSLLRAGYSMNKTSQLCEVPFSVVRRINNGKAVRQYRSVQKKTGPNLCTCCGSNEIAPGNRYLCKHCFRTVGDAVIDHPVSVSK